MTSLHGPRKHAVSPAYVVPVEGACPPQQDALELTRCTPDEARKPAVLKELANGQNALLLQELASLSV